MMSSSESSFNKENNDNIDVEILFKDDLSSSEDPPREEWSSLISYEPKTDIKILKAAEGLYDPGSGEICAKYISQSRSSLLLHPYYPYPAISDPGIIHAIHNPILPKVIYDDDGQELYLDKCKQLGICVNRLFYRQLLEDTVDLKYYGISWKGVLPMATALKLNRHVKVLNLTDNWLNDDACYYLGEMLVSNATLTELNLTGCRIGVTGAMRICFFLPKNNHLKVLNFSNNQLGDDGLAHLAQAINQGSNIANINLSFNNLTAKSIFSLKEAFETNNNLTHLNLASNMIMSPKAVYELCEILSDNLKLQELDLSWNALKGGRIGEAFKMLIKHPNLRRLILRNNYLEGLAIAAIAVNLVRSPKFEVLDLSNNPMTPLDAMKLLNLFKKKKVKLQQLIMENVTVSDTFVETLKHILELKNRINTVVIYGDVRVKYVPVGLDLREIALNRADALARKRSTKQDVKDVALIILELFKQTDQISPKDFDNFFKFRGLKLNEELIELIGKLFPGRKTESGRQINLVTLVDYVKRKWPDKKLPPTPPPTPPPPPPPPMKDKKGKGKKNKK